MVMWYHWGHGVRHAYSHQSLNICQNGAIAGSEKEHFRRERSGKKLYLKQVGAVLMPRVHVTSHSNEENEETQKGNREAGDDDDKSDRESYDDYGLEDDADNISEESDEISDDNIEQ
jgi:hypothetical protein